jgi:hypothetical protein
MQQIRVVSGQLCDIMSDIDTMSTMKPSPEVTRLAVFAKDLSKSTTESVGQSCPS